MSVLVLSFRRLAGYTLLALVLATVPAIPALAAEGDTPLHRAALRDDAEELEALLAAGADPNVLNAAGATPLHYAVASERMVAALLARGARADVVSKGGVTPLMGAVGRPHSFPVARRLIDAGAKVNAYRQASNGLLGNASLLAIAIAAGDGRTAKLLLERGAEVNPAVGTTPLMAAAIVNDLALAEDLLAHGADLDIARNLQGTALNAAFFTGNFDFARLLIERGANLALPTRRGHATPPIVLSAYQDGGDPAVTKLLVERGVDINTANDVGETALSYALKSGPDTELVRYLTALRAEPPLARRHKPVPTREVPPPGEARDALVRASAQRAVDLLQRSSTAFLENRFVRERVNCVSCHQQALPAVAFGLARERGLRIDEHAVGRLLAATVATRTAEVENARQTNEPTPGGGLTLGYDADGFHALGYTSDEMMESFSSYLLRTQHDEGSWPDRARRPPMVDGPIVSTAWTLRAVQLYPPAGRASEVAEALQRSRTWLRHQPTESLNDRIFQLLGLAWADEAREETAPLAEALLHEQRANGSWAQLPGLEGDAWATGSALVALHKAGIPPSHPGYRSGVGYLLQTQFDDGSWWVRSRAWPFQPHFDGKFPHGKDQWISAAGTAWATIALLATLEPTVPAAQLPNAQQLIATFQKTAGHEPAILVAAADKPARTFSETVDFFRDIRPVFARSCSECHGGSRPKGDLSLASRDDLLKGGQSGESAIIPGHAESSPLYLQAADQVEDLEMPPLHRRDDYAALSSEELDRLRQWIDAGAPWPRSREQSRAVMSQPDNRSASSR